MRAPFTHPCSVDVILFDFGGVIAEEGFRDGLFAIARRNGLEPEPFAKKGFELVYETGFVLGRSDESAFWQALRQQTHITGADDGLRREVLSRFKLRAWMIELVKRLKESGVRSAILSDQCNWLDELDAHFGFFKWFDHVFNSYHLGKSKKDPSIFDDVLQAMGVEARQALFVDDHPAHVERAKHKGLHAIVYADRKTFQADLARFCPDLMPPHQPADSYRNSV